MDASAALASGRMTQSDCDCTAQTDKIVLKIGRGREISPGAPPGGPPVASRQRWPPPRSPLGRRKRGPRARPLGCERAELERFEIGRASTTQHAAAPSFTRAQRCAQRPFHICGARACAARAARGGRPLCMARCRVLRRLCRRVASWVRRREAAGCDGRGRAAGNRGVGAL